MNSSEQNRDRIERYRRLRASARQMLEPLLAASQGPQFDMRKAARKLTLPVDGQIIIFDDETDSAALMDFYFHEMRFGGNRIVDLAAEPGAERTSEASEILAAHCNSRCSLFAAVSADPDACQIRLRDLLAPGAPEVVLTDISLSKDTQPGSLLFTRVLNCAGIEMSAGLFFSFHAVDRLRLLNAYRERMRAVSEKERSQRTFIFFYQKYREFGLPQGYAEIT